MADRQPHVCIFTSAHPLDDVRVHTKMARSFVDAGFRVTWVGPDVAYFAEGPFRDPDLEYRLFPPPASRLDRLRGASRAAKLAAGMTDVDWWYSPDPDAARLLPKLARRYGGRTMFDVHEVFHGALLDRWVGGRDLPRLREVVRKRVAATCSKLDLTIGVSETVLRPYVGNTDNVLVVRNCAPAWFADAVEPAVAAEGRMLVTHGKVIPSNGTSVIVSALAALRPPRPELLVLMSEAPGRGPDPFLAATRAEVVQAGVSDLVMIRPGVAHAAMRREMQSCEVGMIAYGRALGVDSLPNRLFEYMASGLAVLAPDYSVDIRRIVEDEGIGITADFEDPRAVAAALQWLYDHPEERRQMGKRAREAFLATYSWEQQIGELNARMESALCES